MEKNNTLSITVPKSGSSLELRELWEYRELLYFLTWRDIKVRYKQAALGATWAILQPFMTMVVFSIFFGRLAKIPSDGIPYPIFAYCALLPWQLFAHSLSESSNSLVANQNLITKVYFPRLVIPISAILAGLVDFAVAFVVLIGMMFYYGIVPTHAIFFLPLFLILTLASSLAVGLWLSAFNVQFRDVRYIVPFLIQFWLFATPIAYPSSLVPDAWKPLFGLNPMAGVVEGFRWVLLGANRPDIGMLIVSSLTVFALLIGGLIYFRRMERSFADII
ncbi:MAG: ABC transporter permease [Candidatus Omnitrophica bacterium]|nr:ABC transporter permease [Candidatus Omnitrophota bacterium]